MDMEKFIAGLQNIDKVVKKAGGEAVIYRHQGEFHLGIMYKRSWVTDTDALPLANIGNLEHFATALETMLTVVRSIDALKVNERLSNPDHIGGDSWPPVIQERLGGGGGNIS